MTSPAGLLLLNLGTPDAPQTAPVRRYLRQFLTDPRVIDIPAPARWALVNLIILPTRPAKSAHAYQQIWTAEGSPLLVHSLALRDRMRERLGDGWRVELGMRYGNPSIESALEALLSQGVERIVAAPLFPQYSSAATGSAVEELYRLLGKRWNVPPVQVLGDFYEDPRFLDAFADVGRPSLQAFAPDHVLFSFHGLPERQIEKSDETGAHCLRSDSCCAQITQANRYCYRAQSFATARGIAQRLGLAEGSWSVSFQSRLGRTPWIKPYTDIVLPELAQRGVKRVLVFCPAFVADCLETLEEVAIRNRALFRESGGDDLQLVPSLNAAPGWVEGLAQLVLEQAPAPPSRMLPVAR